MAALRQITNERKRRIAQEGALHREHRREQASLIAAWPGPGVTDSDANPSQWTPVYLVNGSTEPAYSVVTCIVDIQGTGPHTTEELITWREQSTIASAPLPLQTLSILPPGRWLVKIPKHWSWGMGGRSGAEVAFTDRAGVHWIRRATGDVEELPAAPLHHFGRLGLRGPHDLATPDPWPG